MSKPGTIESLVYDVRTGMVATACAFGISFLINSFLCYRKTHNAKDAVIEGIIAGGKSGALVMATHILVSQLSRTEVFSNIMTKGVIQSGAITAAVGFVIFSIPETIRFATKRISGAQYATNLAVLSASIIGGAVGGYLGACGGMAIGAWAGAGVGSVPMAIATGAGGAVGGMAGGSLVGIGTSKVIDIFFEGDDKRLARLFNAISVLMINEYLLDELEIEEFVASMNKIVTRKFDKLFKDIHASSEQVQTIRGFLEPYFKEIVSKREKYIPAFDVIRNYIALHLPLIIGD